MHMAGGGGGGGIRVHPVHPPWVRPCTVPYLEVVRPLSPDVSSPGPHRSTVQARRSRRQTAKKQQKRLHYVHRLH
jgi:hypothetical protein